MSNILQKQATKIRSREEPKDIFFTPIPIAKLAIDMIGTIEGKWLDPFKGTGNYYNQFPTENKDWCELTDGKDFFDYNENVDIICSNPPFSKFKLVLEHCVKLNPKIISLIFGIANLTCTRLKYMNDNGYYISKIHFFNVNEWFLTSLIIQFEKCDKNLFSFSDKSFKNTIL